MQHSADLSENFVITFEWLQTNFRNDYTLHADADYMQIHENVWLDYMQLLDFMFRPKLHAVLQLEIIKCV